MYLWRRLDCVRRIQGERNLVTQIRRGDADDP
jgi:hypothetical protein